MRLRESLPPRDRKSFNTTAKILFDSEAFTVAFYHRRGRPPASTGDALGIDLFARACMKTCDQPMGRARHASASIGKETAAQRATCRRPQRFRYFRSERVFCNEFPYLGRACLAGWAGLRPDGGNGFDRHIACPRPQSSDTGPIAGAGDTCNARAESESRSQGSAEG